MLAGQAGNTVQNRITGQLQLLMYGGGGKSFMDDTDFTTVLFSNFVDFCQAINYKCFINKKRKKRKHGRLRMEKKRIYCA